MSSALKLKPFYGCYDMPYYKVVKCEIKFPTKNNYYLAGEIYSRQIPDIFRRDEPSRDFNFDYSPSYYYQASLPRMEIDEELLEEIEYSRRRTSAWYDSDDSDDLIDFLN